MKNKRMKNRGRTGHREKEERTGFSYRIRTGPEMKVSAKQENLKRKNMLRMVFISSDLKKCSIYHR